MSPYSVAAVVCLSSLLAGVFENDGTASADDFPAPVNTQAPGEHPPLPEDMPALFDMPEGFQVTLFAGEPDVQQPIAFEVDDRGRLWVAENYTYSARGQVDDSLRDRIIILEDRDQDGRHDHRTVFWDRGRMLTGLTCGFGGVWILNDGTLSFLPDADGNDVPDGEPIVALNGWTKTAGHNFVNGLLWGPDGWLYGRHGITDTSWPGLPDTPQDERAPMNCGIWRYHPVRREFEIVCHGTTNPWGLDYDQHGQMFMTNNVIGHLWHVVPGAHYERMFGQDFNPHLYELMSQTADHYHWDHSGNWTESRDGQADSLGGGHSHCGGLIYSGTQFPEEFRGRLLMCNTHGRCINVDRLERHGSGYVGRHEPNLLTVRTLWFRGTELREAPDGAVYLSDWADNGECHDHDGVHRTSGRIYRISYGETAASPLPDLQTLSDASLARLCLDGSEWISRRARRVLQERFVGGFRSDAAAVLMARQNDSVPARQRLRSLWALAALDILDEQLVLDLLAVDDEHLQGWAVRLGAERSFFVAPPPDPSTSFERSDAGGVQPLIDVCATTDSDLVLLSMASAMQKLDVRARRLVAHELVGRLAERNDRNLVLMTWYALVDEPSPAGLLYVLSGTRAPPDLLRFVARRVVQLPDQRDAILSHLLSRHGTASSEAAQVAVLTGMQQGLRGQYRPEPPSIWTQVGTRLEQADDPEIARLARELSVYFGDGAALSDLRSLVADRNGDHAARSQAVAALARAGDDESVELFFRLLNDRAVYDSVVRALAEFDHPETPHQLITRWDNLRHGTKALAIDTLASRRPWAIALVDAIEAGRIDSQSLSASQVRQLLSFDDPHITQVVESHWGIINDSSAARAQAIEDWRQRLDPQTLRSASLSNGAKLFRKSCGNCHRLYGEGSSVGPDLTGSNRGNLDYLLSNIIDPSQVVPRQFTMSVIALRSGRVLNGVVIAETEDSLTLQTDKEQVVVGRRDIEERVQTTRSLMPDGLLDPLTPNEVRDLIAHLMHRR